MQQKEDNKNIIDVIDARLEQLKREQEEIEKNYGIDEQLLNSFSFSGRIYIPTPQEKITLSKSNKRTYFTNLTKIDDTIKPKEPKVQYKTPEMLIDSLKNEPNIKDLLDKETFEPTFTSLNVLKSKPSIQKSYDVTDYVKDTINQDYYDSIMH